MDEFIKTFHIDWKLMLAQVFNFALVFVVFYFLASKPLSKLMKDRTEEIETGLINGEKNAKILKATKEEYEIVIAKAKNEANVIFQSGKKEAEEKKASMLEEARREVAGIIESGKKTLEVEKVKMVAEAKNEVAGLAIAAVEKLLADKGDSYNAKVKRELNHL